MCELQVPNSQIALHPGDIVKLHRFDDERWEVGCGWFSFGGNNPMNGWYFTSKSRENTTKPIHLRDLDDIYVLEFGSRACKN